MSCICLGPKRAGKTHLLKALQDPEAIDETSYSPPTNGTCIYTIHFPPKSGGEATGAVKSKTTGEVAVKIRRQPEVVRVARRQSPLTSIRILEIGGSMAPIWRHYYNDVHKLIYVVDTANLCQISAAGVLLYSILAEPRLQKVRILLVLSKMDYAYRQMRNEALLMLQMSKLQKEIQQNITIVEASSVTKVGFDDIYEWLRQP